MRTCNGVVGELVPIPTFPFAKIVNRVVVAVPSVVEAMLKSGVLTVVLIELEIDKREYGEVEPIPTRPDESKIPPPGNKVAPKVAPPTALN